MINNKKNYIKKCLLDLLKKVDYEGATKVEFQLETWIFEAKNESCSKRRTGCLNLRGALVI